MTEKRNNDLNVPNLRFPGFEDEWKKSTLAECSISIEYGMNAAAKSFDGENKYIRITDIDEKTSLYISDSPVSPDGELTDKYVLHEGDILFARTGASTGKSYMYSSRDGKLYFAGFLIRARIKNTLNTRFIFAQTQTENYNKWVKLMSMRSGQPGINSQEYGSYTLNLPSRKEQDKVALLLEKIDERIQTQNKIIENLESLIKSICQKFILSNAGNKKLNKCVTCYTSNLTEAVALLQSGRYPIYGATGLIAYSENYQIKENAILIIKDGASIGRVKLVKEKVSVIGTLNYLLANKNISLEYIFYCLKYLNFSKYKVGSGIPHIYFRDYGEAMIYCPSYNEQLKLSSFLVSIEEKLMIEKEILQNLQIQKQYLLSSLII